MTTEQLKRAKEIQSLANAYNHKKNSLINALESWSNKTVSCGDDLPITRDFTMKVADDLIRLADIHFNAKIQNLTDEFEKL